MAASFWWRAAATWGLLVLLAFGAGALRESVYLPLFGRALAEGLTTAKLIALWLVVTCGFLTWHRGAYRRRHLPWLGGLWVTLALLLEFALRYLAGATAPVATLYAGWHGELWVLHVAALYFVPILAGRVVRPE